MTARAIAVAAALALVGVAAADGPAPARSGADRAEGARAWRTARWGMTVEEVLRAFPGEATRLERSIALADGRVVAAGIDGHGVGPDRFQVRFVFEAGRLALVSLRTPERTYAPADRYAAVGALLAHELGGPGEETRDDTLVDLRQRRWEIGATRVDLEYIPGVVVVLYSPLAGAAADPGPARAVQANVSGADGGPTLTGPRP